MTTTTQERRTRIVDTGTIILNRDAFTPDALKHYGCDNLTQFAHYIGVHRTTMKRAYSREADIGGRLMALLLSKTNRRFNDLFITLTAPTVVSLPGDTDYDPGDWPPGGPHGIGI